MIKGLPYLLVVYQNVLDGLQRDHMAIGLEGHRCRTDITTDLKQDIGSPNPLLGDGKTKAVAGIEFCSLDLDKLISSQIFQGSIDDGGW